MNMILNRLKGINAKGCITIILSTHRSKPGYLKDPVNLRNLIKEAETRLLSDYEEKFARPLIEKMNSLAEKIDHSQNLDSLILFVNEELAEYVRLPVEVENRVVIDDTFATRALVRALHQEKSYYILLLSRDKARLIEATNDMVTNESGGAWPMESQGTSLINRGRPLIVKELGYLAEEFFNKVDKQLNTELLKNRLPVLICTEERNYHLFLKVADKNLEIIGNLNKNRLDEPAHIVAKDAWPVVQNSVLGKNKERITELYYAFNSGKFLSDYNDIWRAIHEGRGKTLFVQKGFFQPARLVENRIEIVPAHEAGLKDVVDDIIDEMIEFNISFGGDVVFLSADDLKEFKGLALVTRY